MSKLKAVRGGRWSVSVWQEWTEWFHVRDFNWTTFTFATAYVESTRYRGRGYDTVEIHVALLGFHLLVERYDGTVTSRFADPAASRNEWPFEVRLDDYAGEVDEIVGRGYLHMERLDDDLWWFSVTPEGKTDRLAWTICGKTLTVTECDGLGLDPEVARVLIEGPNGAPPEASEEPCAHKWEFVGESVNTEETCGVCTKCGARYPRPVPPVSPEGGER